MEYTIQKLASLAGTTTRTLRYYDKIGLLKPMKTTPSGYRVYGPQEVDMLQQILFYKELDFPLSEIQALIHSPTFQRMDALKDHLIALEERKIQLEQLIDTVNQTILSEEGTITMSDHEKFEGFKKDLIISNEDVYGKEIREQYGDETVDKSNAKMMKLTQEQYEQFKELEETILKKLEFAVKNNESPKGDAGQKIAKLHKEWLSFTWSSYSKEAHQNLGLMYIGDERFTNYYDKAITGCAAFLKEAIDNFTAV